MRKERELSHYEKQLKEMNNYTANDSQSISNLCEILMNLNADKHSIVNGLQDLVEAVCLYSAMRCQFCDILIDGLSDDINTYDCSVCYCDTVMCSDCEYRLSTPFINNFFCRHCVEQKAYYNKENRLKKKKKKKIRIANGLKRKNSEEGVFIGSKKKIKYNRFSGYVRYMC